MSPSVINEQEPVAESRRLGRLFRRSGSTALSASVEIKDIPETEANNVAETLFGLEEDMAEYVELWQYQQHKIETWLDNDELRENTKYLLHTHADHLSVPRSKKQDIHRFAEEGYPRLVGLFAGLGRLDAHKYAPLKNKGLSDGVDEITGYLNQHRLITSKVQGIFSSGNMRLSGDLLPMVEKKFMKIREDVAETYKPIYKKEWSVAGKVQEKIIDNPDAAREFLETFQASVMAETVTERAFARLFANRHITFKENSELSLALQVMQEHASGGGLAYSFLQEKIESNNGDNIWAFLANNDPKGFVVNTARLFCDWPSDLKSEYQDRSEEIIKDFKIMVNNLASKSKFKPWLQPDIDQIEIAADKIFTTIYDRYVDQPMNSGTKTQGRVTAKSKLSAEDLIAQHEDSGELEKPLAISVIKLIGQSTFIHEGVESSEQIVAEFMGNNPKDRTYHAELTQVIDKLRVNPTQNGVISLHQTKKGRVNGMELKWLRANLTHMELPELSRRTRNSRVIFAVSKETNEMFVYTIAGNHDDYEIKIRQLMAAR